MSNLNKIDVPVALEHKTKLDLSFDHVTTMDFMTLQPVGYRHCIKKESLSMKVMSVVRPAPIEVPTFGRLRQNLRAFFVPYRLVFPNWNEFYNDVIASNYNANSLVSSVPLLPNSAIKDFFFNTHGGTETICAKRVASGQPYDFEVNTDHWKLKPYGRKCLKILESLGYKILLHSKDDNVMYNALGLLAYAKVYVDWYANSQYLNSLDVLALERLFKFNDPSNTLILDEFDVGRILGLVGTVVYDNEDYYINAWDNPVSPNSGQFTSFSFVDPTSTGGAYVQTNANGSPEMVASNLYPQSIGTTYIHEALKKLTDFQKRHALAGARAIDRVLAQYGVITDSLKQARSIYVGSQSIDINIGSVMATSDSTNGNTISSTGDYAGAGYGQGENSWDFIPDEEGIFIVMASIIPTASFVQGYDRNNLHINKFDFFVPEFDSLGVQAIEKGEVYVSDNDSFAINDTADYLGVYGFSGRYGEYKRPKSFLTGDIRVKSFEGQDSWHLFRMFEDVSFADVNGLVHSLSLTRGEDAEQYHRMFQYREGDVEPFFCFLHFDFAVFAPCKPLFETYEFDSNAKRVPTENGNKLN